MSTRSLAIEHITQAQKALTNAIKALSEPIFPQPDHALKRHEIRFNGDGTATFSDYLAELERGEHGDGARASWVRGKAGNPELEGTEYSCVLIEQPGKKRWVFLRTDQKNVYRVNFPLNLTGDLKIRLRPYHSYLKGFTVPRSGVVSIGASRFIGDRFPWRKWRNPKGW